MDLLGFTAGKKLVYPVIAASTVGRRSSDASVERLKRVESQITHCRWSGCASPTRNGGTLEAIDVNLRCRISSPRHFGRG